MFLRAGIAAAVLIGAMAITATRIGEPDRTLHRVHGTVRAIQTAQSAYRDLTGRYVTLACLAGGPCARGPRRVLLDPRIAALEDRDGYRFRFHPGPAAPASAGLAPAPEFSAFAVTAVPVDPTNTVRPSLCGDDTGAIHVIADGSTPRVEAGRCPLPSDR